MVTAPEDTLIPASESFAITNPKLSVERRIAIKFRVDLQQWFGSFRQLTRLIIGLDTNRGRQVTGLEKFTGLKTRARSGFTMTRAILEATKARRSGSDSKKKTPEVGALSADIFQR